MSSKNTMQLGRGVLLALVSGLLTLGCKEKVSREEEREREMRGEPESEREESALPRGYFNHDARDQVYERRLEAPANAPAWEAQGPYGIGRVAALAVHPTNDQIVFVASGGGGVWKTSDGGNTFKQVLHQAKSQHIGDVQISKANPNIVWVGTGEPNAGGGGLTYTGDGVWKSTDGGNTFTNMGLPDSYVIGRISIHPTNPDIVLVAVQGSFWAPSPERGIYRTDNGGVTWTRTDFVDATTGACDVHFWPTDPNRVFANFWYAQRDVYARTWTGPTCRVHRSDDGGLTWRILGAAEGLPTTDLGKSTIGIAESNPNTMYMFYLAGNNNMKAIYKTLNGGGTWAPTAGVPPTSNFSYYAHYFVQIRVNPTNPNDVVTGGIGGYRSTDGGSNWTTCFLNTHSDQHAFEWSKQNSGGLFYLGDDGGLAKSNSPNGSFTYLGTSPTSGMQMAQIYSMDISPANPANTRFVALQDNFTQMTTNGGSTWQQIIPGDGMFVKVDHGNTANVMGCLQDGNCQRSGQSGSGMAAISGLGTRGPWDTNGDIDPVNGNAYLGYEFVHRAPRGSSSFIRISPDLSNGDHSVANYGYGTVSAISVYNNVAYAGTDDGNVWYTKDASVASPQWTKIRTGRLATSGTEKQQYDGWIKDVNVDQTVAGGGTAYLAISYLRWGQDKWKPAIYKLTNFGAGGPGSADWKDITGDLPRYLSINDIIPDPTRPDWYYAGTEYGVYYTSNGGTNWNWLGNDVMPITTINDILIHKASNTLYAATYGRGMFRIPLADLTPVSTGPKAYVGNQMLKSFPNPVSLSARVQFQVRNDQSLLVALYDMSGRMVKTLLDGPVKAGKAYNLTWNRTDDRGTKVEAGNYVLRAVGNKVTMARKVDVR